MNTGIDPAFLANLSCFIFLPCPRSAAARDSSAEVDVAVVLLAA